MERPIYILVAPNGARKTKADHPHLPITPEELAQEAVRCAKAGAVLFHLHIRGDNQEHSLDPQRYQKALKAIQGQVGDQMLLQVSTETCDIFTPNDQMATVRALNPEAVSIGIRELIPDLNHVNEAQAFLHDLHAKGVNVQYILYSAEDVAYWASLVQQGVVPHISTYFLLFVLGKKASGQVAFPSDLDPLLEARQKYLKNIKHEWTLCAFGPNELDCMLKAVQEGGHVRIGFENNMVLADGRLANTNAELLDQFVSRVKQVSSRPIALKSDLLSLLR